MIYLSLCVFSHFCLPAVGESYSFQSRVAVASYIASYINYKEQTINCNI